MANPLQKQSIKVRNFKCFGETEGGFDQIMPINVVIGRNNSGKSALVDLLAICVNKQKEFNAKLHQRGASDFELQFAAELQEHQLRPIFQESTSGGSLPGNHWEFGRRFIGKRVTIGVGQDWKPRLISSLDFPYMPPHHRAEWERQIAARVDWPLDGCEILRISAERDVRPEERSTKPTISPNGEGATNLIRAFINQDDLPREEVETHLLADLNEIYSGDSEFQRISCRENDKGTWEIFLWEESKGDIRLSQSGSSLKSVFIILSYLRLSPHLKKVDWGKVIFAVEEPENNLHPALLRRLLDFLAKERAEKQFTLVLTTHSPIGIDWASRREDSQIIHVQNADGSAVATPSTKYITNRAILDDLDIRASDMLQANGIVWLEGPSDRIYLRHWIDLRSGGSIKEGIHYSMMFYGGRLLNHLESNPPEHESALISILSLNRNLAVVIDSDMHLGRAAGDGKAATKPRMSLNKTKERIQAEVTGVGGFVWVTQGREIENYVPNHVFERVIGSGKLEAGMYDDLPEHPFLDRFKKNKIDLAHAVVGEFKAEEIEGHLDLVAKVDELIGHIKKWNRISVG